MHRSLVVLAAMAMLGPVRASAQGMDCTRSAGNSRLLVVSDIGNEPDDAESLVRLLLYTNEIDVEGLVASTSVWQRERTRPELMRERIDAYAQILPNLRTHDCRFPEANMFKAAVKVGSAQYGMVGVGAGRGTEGSRAIISAIDRDDPRPLWIALWGGAVDLAQALWDIKATRDPAAIKRAVGKLRIYAISDQDDAGPWIRRNFPQLFWVGSIHAFNDYSLATWRGLSGDLYRKPNEANPPVAGPDGRLVTNAWLEANIRRGPLGEKYPPWLYAMEGDTPSFLNLVRNGLSDPAHPDWGGWGGRYGKISSADGLFTDASDSVMGKDGQRYRDNQATIWRWREAYQNDFAARIAWTVSPDFKSANHPPRPIVRGDNSDAILSIRAEPDELVELDASESSDPDGDALTFQWFFYPEASGTPHTAPPALTGADSARVSFKMPEDGLSVLHLILAVRDRGTPAITRYKRIIFCSSHRDCAASPS